MNVPNHEKKAFRDMTPEERAGIVEAWVSNQIDEMGALDCHCVVPRTLDIDGIYRTRPRKLVIPWEHIKPEYKWAAMDESGVVWMHKEEPGICLDGWFSTGNCAYAILNIDTAGIDWRESLTARPEGV